MRLQRARDKWSFRTHAAGAVLGIFATLQMTMAHPADVWPFLMFGLTIIGLYSCSALYHFVPGPESRIARLRKLDHSMIFVLIAGTYTPVLTTLFPTFKAVLYMGVMWGVAVLGTVMKLVWMKAPRWLYTSLYVFMGWAALWEMPFLFHTARGLTLWLIAGGVAYTAGAVMYALKKPNISREFGFHELFHVFILLGTLCHFIGITTYLA